MSDKYAAITRDRARFPVRLMCRALGVSVSGYYAAQRRRPSRRAMRDERLRVEIRTVFTRTRGRYGSPRIHDELRDAGVRTSGKRIARLMREDDLVARRPRRWVATTDSTHAMPIASNRLARDFAVRPDRPLDSAWVGDMTHVPTRSGTLYLAVLLDVASRRVVGWAIADSLETSLPLRALMMALQQRRPSAGLIHHTDRGAQYASHTYRTVLATHGIQLSMSEAGDCYDNAVAESFFATVEHELFSRERLTVATAHAVLFEFIEVWYNRQRRHSSLGSMSPACYEALRGVA